MVSAVCELFHAVTFPESHTAASFDVLAKIIATINRPVPSVSGPVAFVKASSQP